MTRALRPYQREACEAVREAWDGGCQRPAVVMATGLGKTDVLAALAAERVRAGHRVLVLAHRLELLRQVTARCRMHLPDLPRSAAGIVAGDIDQRNASIVAAMVPTLRHARRRARLRPYMAGDLVIVDEAHHAGAKSYVDVLEWAGVLDESSGVEGLGLTATMYQSGKSYRGLGDVWQKVVFERGIGWAIDQGWLVPLRGLTVVAEHLDLSKAKTRTGDWAEGELGAMVAQDAEQIADAWCAHAADRLTVGFLPTREAAEAQRAAFARRGVACELVLGDTSSAERGDVESGTGIYGRLTRGETRVLLGLMVPTEGWDAPPVSCVLMARPTKIDGLYQQCVGRGARLSPGKSDCLVLDVVGVTRTASLRTLTDLLPGAEYRDPRPQVCPRCGREKAPADRFDPKCVCPPAERDPDAGRLRLLGPARYEEVDLFGGQDVDDDGTVNWLATPGGIAFVPAKDRLVVLLPDGPMWKAGVVHRDRRDRGERLVAGVPAGEAKATAEDWLKMNVEPTYWHRQAAWRRKGSPGTPGQISAARAMGIVGAERYDRAALSDLLSIASAARRLDRSTATTRGRPRVSSGWTSCSASPDNACSDRTEE